MKRARLFKLIIAVVCTILVVVIIIIINGLYQNRKLFDAIENDDYKTAQEAIENGAWVNARRHLLYIAEIVPTNPTPLIAACKNGNEEIVELLLENGADINKIDNFTGQTALLAALHGRKENRFSLAMYMIENGADIFISQSATSPFEEVLVVLDTDSEKTINEGFEVFKYLIKNKINITICTGNENALTFATHYNNYNVVKYLIEEAYFDVNIYDENGDTALIVAVKNNNTEIIELLLELGADKSLKNYDGKTALDYAKESSNSDISRLLNN